ncbi:capsid maturation protease [Mycobacterium Phage Nergal]|nr:capsid maturation protease [Mycobacterium Phage Nergal]
MNAAQYRALLNAAIASLEALVRAVLARDGVPVTEEQRQAAALAVLRQVQQARQETHNAARRYLSQLTAGANSSTPPEPQEYGLGAPVELMRRVVDQQGVTAENRTQPLVARKTARAISRGLQRHAETPARELVVAAADAEPEGAWQRILVGERSCYFCAMLASRGPIYSTRHEALTGKGKGESLRDGQLVYVYHDGCDCLVVFVPKGAKDWEGRQEWLRLQHMWREADKDPEDSSIREDGDERETREVFRSWWEKQVRKGNTARYIPDSIVKSDPEPPIEDDENLDEPDILNDEPEPEPEPELPRPADDPLPSLPVKADEADDADQAREDDRRVSNPNNGNGNARYSDNCTHCVNAFELRRRGYDVEATAAPNAGGRYTDKEILSRWVDPDGNVRRLTTLFKLDQNGNFKPGTKADLDRIVKGWGEGARGWVTVQWRGGGGHIFAVENVGGKARYIEPQVPGDTDDVGDYLKVARRRAGSYIHYVRTDDLTPTDKVLDPSDPLVRARSEGQAERDELAANAKPIPTLEDLVQGAKAEGFDYHVVGVEQFNAFRSGALYRQQHDGPAPDNWSADPRKQEAFIQGWFWYARWRTANS